MSGLSIAEAQALVDARHWKHSFEIIPGVVSKGDWGLINSGKMLDELYGLPRDMRGWRALDVGTLDGVHAFELERRGASVVACDIQSSDRTGFNTAKMISGSKVEYHQASVYDLTRILKHEFDLVLFFGVWYHLKNPVKAFEEIATVMKDGAIMCGEGEALFDYVEINGVGQQGEARDLAMRIGRSPVAYAAYYAGTVKGDLWSWFTPNLACVKAWCETAGLEMERHTWLRDHPHQRLHIVARKSSRIKTTVDNPVW